MPVDLPPLGRLQAERATLPPPSRDHLAFALKGLPHVALLDSASGGRFTVLASRPMARLRWTAEGGEIALPGGARVRDETFESLLREALAATALRDGDAPLPFGPGWIGCFGYGLRTAFEDVPERHEDDTGIADVDLAYYPAVAVYDAHEESWWFLWRENAADTVRALQACLHGAARSMRFRMHADPEPRQSRDEYLAAVRRAVEYIHAGDVFQVNFAHEFRADADGDPAVLYGILRDMNPAPYGAYLDLGHDRAILSTSPELFLQLRGDEVVTRPIKGTRPRGRDEQWDRWLIEEPENSEKDAAELAMIVDLERNDLGRVCAPGTVEVVEEATIETYASVHHRVAEVRGRLESGYDRVDLLRATFPGGSITGAPKVRAMEIIDELEQQRRGPYTGSIGILTDDGNMDLNIAIRTAVYAAGEVRVQVGGGIVADSDPEAEYEETLAKGKAIFEALRK